MYSKFGRIIGKKKAKEIKIKLNYAGMKIDPYEWAGFLIVFSSLVGVFIFIITRLFTPTIYSIILGIIAAIATYGILETAVDLLIDARRRFVESILPDILSLISINLRGGLSIEDAFMASVRPEFGFFSKELLRVSKMIHSGRSVQNSLDSLNKNVKSNMLKRITNLIIEGINSGGEIAIILDKLSDMLRKISLTEEERRSSTKTYFWFIVIASSIAAPLLFSAAYFLEEMLYKLTPHAITNSKFSISILPPNLVFYFLLANLLIIESFSGILAGVIIKGKEKYGLKYLPILLTISLITFLSVNFLLRVFFGNI